MSSILDRIVATKHQEIASLRARVSLADLERCAVTTPTPHDFRGALERAKGMAIIAEVKRASPSAGLIRADFDPVAIARGYQKHGASCISVLTDESYFQGSLDDLQDVRTAVGIPLLRKDFILDRIQLLEARSAGAAAVLLIAEILDDTALQTLLKQAQELKLQTLVELYEPRNLARVLDAGARLVGINNRNLNTFEVRLEQTLELADKMPKDVLLVSESGIRDGNDVKRLAAAGVKAILVGETLMRAADIGTVMKELKG